MSQLAFLVLLVRSRGYAWREEDVRDRFHEWSALLCGAEVEANRWGGCDVEMVLDAESLVDALDSDP
jgi:hypothetical protein